MTDPSTQWELRLPDGTVIPLQNEPKTKGPISFGLGSPVAKIEILNPRGRIYNDNGTGILDIRDRVELYHQDELMLAGTVFEAEDLYWRHRGIERNRQANLTLMAHPNVLQKRYTGNDRFRGDSDKAILRHLFGRTILQRETFENARGLRELSDVELADGALTLKPDDAGLYPSDGFVISDKRTLKGPGNRPTQVRMDVARDLGGGTEILEEDLDDAGDVDAAETSASHTPEEGVVHAANRSQTKTEDFSDATDVSLLEDAEITGGEIQALGDFVLENTFDSGVDGWTGVDSYTTVQNDGAGALEIDLGAAEKSWGEEVASGTMEFKVKDCPRAVSFQFYDAAGQLAFLVSFDPGSGDVEFQLWDERRPGDPVTSNGWRQRGTTKTAPATFPRNYRIHWDVNDNKVEVFDGAESLGAWTGVDFPSTVDGIDKVRVGGVIESYDATDYPNDWDFEVDPDAHPDTVTSEQRAGELWILQDNFDGPSVGHKIEWPSRFVPPGTRYFILDWEEAPFTDGNFLGMGTTQSGTDFGQVQLKFGGSFNSASRISVSASTSDTSWSIRAQISGSTSDNQGDSLADNEPDDGRTEVLLSPLRAQNRTDFRGLEKTVSQDYSAGATPGWTSARGTSTLTNSGDPFSQSRIGWGRLDLTTSGSGKILLDELRVWPGVTKPEFDGEWVFESKTFTVDYSAREAKLALTKTTPAGSSIALKVSLDGGTNFRTLADDTMTYFEPGLRGKEVVVRLEATSPDLASSPSVDDYTLEVVNGYETDTRTAQSPKLNSETFTPVRATCSASIVDVPGSDVTMEVSFNGGISWTPFDPQGETLNVDSTEVSSPPDVRWKATGTNPGESTTWKLDSVKIVTEAGGGAGSVTPSISTDDGNTFHEIKRVEDDVAVWYRFDETSGSTADDVTDDERDGTINGNPTLGADGQDGTAYTFDGTDDHVASPAFTVTSGDAPFSLEAWVKADNVGARSDIVSVQGAGVFISFNADGTLRFKAAGASAQSTDAYDDDAWHHVVGVYEGSGVRRLYVDGELVAEESDGATEGNHTDGIMVATNGAASDHFLAGTVDEPRVWTRALTLEEAKSLHDNGYAENTLLLGQFANEGKRQFVWKVLLETSDSGQTPLVERVSLSWECLGYTDVGLGEVNSLVDSLDIDILHMLTRNGIEAVINATGARVRYRLDRATKTYLLDYNYSQTTWTLTDDVPTRIESRTTDTQRDRVKVIG